MMAELVRNLRRKVDILAAATWTTHKSIGIAAQARLATSRADLGITRVNIFPVGREWLTRITRIRRNTTRVASGASGTECVIDRSHERTCTKHQDQANGRIDQHVLGRLGLTRI